MITIHLKDIAFRAFHGVYEEETKLGNEFIVNLHVHYIPLQPVVKDLKDAVNYENLFTILHKRMMQPTPLLETLAMELCHQILNEFEMVHAVFVSVEKTNPPIPSFNGGVVVAYQLSREPGNLKVRR